MRKHKLLKVLNKRWTTSASTTWSTRLTPTTSWSTSYTTTWSTALPASNTSQQTSIIIITQIFEKRHNLLYGNNGGYSGNYAFAHTVFDDSTNVTTLETTWLTERSPQNTSQTTAHMTSRGTSGTRNTSQTTSQLTNWNANVSTSWNTHQVTSWLIN